MGVSLQGGSGIIISCLAYRTWSDLSNMGVYGLGIGLQFQLEVENVVFIIHTTERMEHVKRGDNFVVGGNKGAVVANYGEEAYSAVIVGTCTERLPLNE